MFKEYIKVHPDKFEIQLYNSSIFSSNSTIKNGSNLSAFLNNPTTTFFILEKEADLDLICIVKFYT